MTSRKLPTIIENIKSIMKEMGWSKNMNCDEGGHPNKDGNYFIGKHVTEKLGHTCIDYSEFYNTLYI
jgi:hypothetical protein